MNNKGLKLALAALLTVSQAFALSEVRTPWISGNGPLRYMFEKHDANEKYDLNLWSAYHTKYANRAFKKHGFKTEEITSLIFNKSSFTLGEAALNGSSNPAGENYNPLADAKTIAPRIEYNETGMTLGGEISMPLNHRKSRVGLRGSVPFRSIDMERLDSGLDKAEDSKADFVQEKVVRVRLGYDGQDRGPVSNISAKAYRLDMVSKLAVDQALIMKTDTAPAVGAVSLFGSVIGANAADYDNQLRSLNTAIVGSRADANRPNAYFVQLQAADAAADANPDATGTYGFNSIHSMDPAGHDTSTQSVLFFDDRGVANDGFDYSALVAARTNFDHQWLVFRRATDSNDPEKFSDGSGEGVAGVGAGIARSLDSVIAQYTQNAFGYLADNGYSLDSQNRTGLGDISLDLFFAHQLHEDWNAEAVLGLVLPTGASKDKYGSAYKPLLGNGEHFELKLASGLAWQPLTWMNVKADAAYNFVLEAKEHRMATFAGSTIQNLAPRADADVDWGYFTGRLDATFFHPKTSDIRSSVGYEFYYKTKDNVSYKQSTGEAFDGTTDNKLDNKLAAANSERIAHKMRFETSYQLSNYLELFCGGSYTFAGQNIQRDSDTHGGFNVRF